MSDVSKLLLRVAQLERALLAERLLHPTGRCGCAGEGRCQWCLLLQTAVDRDEAIARAEKAEAECTKNTEDCKRELAALDADRISVIDESIQTEMKLEAEVARLREALSFVVIRLDGKPNRTRGEWETDRVLARDKAREALGSPSMGTPLPPSEQAKGPAPDANCTCGHHSRRHWDMSRCSVLGCECSEFRMPPPPPSPAGASVPSSEVEALRSMSIASKARRQAQQDANAQVTAAAIAGLTQEAKASGGRGCHAFRAVCRVCGEDETHSTHAIPLTTKPAPARRWAVRFDDGRFVQGTAGPWTTYDPARAKGMQRDYSNHVTTVVEVDENGKEVGDG